jgi:predicted DNA-binding transcriptional regulator AlpA
MRLPEPVQQETVDEGAVPPQHPRAIADPTRRKGPARVLTPNRAMEAPLLTVEDVGRRLNVSKDWVWDHCSRKNPKLPVIRMGDGALRFRASAIESFIDERERLSALRHRVG